MDDDLRTQRADWELEDQAWLELEHALRDLEREATS